jgi:hypothetical protein
MTDVNFNGKNFYIDSSFLNFTFSQLSYSLSLDYQGDKTTSIISGKAVCFFQGFHLIKSGYESNIIQIYIRDIAEADEFNLNKQFQKAKSENWKTFIGIYCDEGDVEKSGDISFVDLDSERSPKISFEIYLSKEQIEMLIYQIRQNPLGGFSMECYFLDLLSDNGFGFPGSQRYIPPREGRTYNCVGELNHIHINRKPIFLNYREIIGNQISTIFNSQDLELQNNKYKDELTVNIVEHKQLMTSQLQIQLKIINEIKSLKYIILLSLILYSIYLVW